MFCILYAGRRGTQKTRVSFHCYHIEHPQQKTQALIIYDNVGGGGWKTLKHGCRWPTCSAWSLFVFFSSTNFSSPFIHGAADLLFCRAPKGSTYLLVYCINVYFPLFLNQLYVILIHRRAVPAVYEREKNGLLSLFLVHSSFLYTFVLIPSHAAIRWASLAWLSW